jgi:hypothetical protein
VRHRKRRLIVAALAAIAPLFLTAPELQSQETGGDHATQPSPEIQRLVAALGTWTVELESRNGPDAPFTRLQTTSTISGLLGGAFIQERLFLPTPDGSRVEMMGIWGYDKYRAIYRFAWLDNAFALFDVFEGGWKDGVLTVDNTRTRTTIIAGKKEYYGRMVWGPFAADGFSVESQVSSDGGATWFTQTRGRYTRAD